VYPVITRILSMEWNWNFNVEWERMQKFRREMQSQLSDNDERCYNTTY